MESDGQQDATPRWKSILIDLGDLLVIALLFTVYVTVTFWAVSQI